MDDPDTDFVVRVLLSTATDENEDSETALQAAEMVAWMRERNVKLCDVTKLQLEFAQSCVQKSMERCELDDFDSLNSLSLKLNRIIEFKLNK